VSDDPAADLCDREPLSTNKSIDLVKSIAKKGLSPSELSILIPSALSQSATPSLIIINNNNMSSSAALARARILSGYRNLTRARLQLFKGDDYAMKESRAQLKQQFEINKNVPTSGPAFEALLQGMDEAAHMLRHEIVRGDLNEDTGRYGMLNFSY
jgi:hypothetical protein